MPPAYRLGLRPDADARRSRPLQPARGGKLHGKLPAYRIVMRLKRRGTHDRAAGRRRPGRMVCVLPCALCGTRFGNLRCIERACPCAAACRNRLCRCIPAMPPATHRSLCCRAAARAARAPFGIPALPFRDGVVMRSTGNALFPHGRFHLPDALQRAFPAEAQALLFPLLPAGEHAAKPAAGLSAGVNAARYSRAAFGWRAGDGPAAYFPAGALCGPLKGMHHARVRMGLPSCRAWLFRHAKRNVRPDSQRTCLLRPFRAADCPGPFREGTLCTAGRHLLCTMGLFNPLHGCLFRMTPSFLHVILPTRARDRTRDISIWGSSFPFPFLFPGPCAYPAGPCGGAALSHPGLTAGKAAFLSPSAVRQCSGRPFRHVPFSRHIPFLR